MRQAGSTILATLAFMLVVAGCGGDEEFAADVGAVCEDAQQKFAKANEKVFFGSDAKQNEEEFRAANEPVYDEFIADLEAVEPPDDLAGDYDAYVAVVREQSEVLLAGLEQTCECADDQAGDEETNHGSSLARRTNVRSQERSRRTRRRSCQIRSVPSAGHAATRVPSGLQATL